MNLQPDMDFVAGACPRGRAVAWLGAVWLSLAFLCPSPGLGAEVSREYQVKAVFLWRLAQFVTWPNNAFERADSPIVIGVLGDNPFGAALETAVRGETAHGRKLVVQQFRQVDQIKTCHVLFINETNAVRVREIIAALNRSSVLTVSDVEGFANSNGGMIRFFNDQNKIKVRVNLEATTAAGLSLDARFLRVAEVIKSQ